MIVIGELLRDADPFRDEPARAQDELDRRRQALLEAAYSTGSNPRARPRIAFFTAVALIAIAAAILASRGKSPFVGTLQAAVRFEVKLAEDKPGAGLRGAKVAGSERTVYLHEEAIVTNADIASARVVPGGHPGHYNVSIEFHASGADKMRTATVTHIGKRVAILIDGEVVMAPAIRSEIGTSAVITGNFNNAQAERIANGIQLQ